MDCRVYENVCGNSGIVDVIVFRSDNNPVFRFNYDLEFSLQIIRTGLIFNLYDLLNVQLPNGSFREPVLANSIFLM